jgi:3-oxoacyl-[acyl-carrier protein] reductase
LGIATGGELGRRTALVTGASRGIGHAIALAFAQHGIDPALTACSASDLAAVQTLTRDQGVRCSTFLADLSEPESPARLVKHFSREFERIDILINNAGIGSSFDPKPLIDFDDEVWDLTQQVNVKVSYLLCRQLVPGMMERG